MNNPSDSTPQLDAQDCLDAIAAGMRALAAQLPDDGPFKLIGVTNLLKGASQPSGPSVWELTFKPARLIPPSTAAEVGAGGELFVRIDLARSENPVRVLRGD